MDGKVVGAVVGSVVAEGSVVEEGAVLGVVDGVVEVLAKEQRTVQLLLTLPQVTVMVAVPAETAVIWPSELTVATSGLEETKVTVSVVSAGVGTALIFQVAPSRSRVTVLSASTRSVQGSVFTEGSVVVSVGVPRPILARTSGANCRKAQISAKAYDCNGQHHDGGH